MVVIFMTDQTSSLHCVYSVHTDLVQINACASFKYKNSICLNDLPDQQWHVVGKYCFRLIKNSEV